MNKCKSCSHNIIHQDLYCGNCGGKIIEKRLSLKGTWEEFIGPFFSWDYNFWKTLLHLLIHPDLVLKSYITGARKKYFQPFSFLILYATIALFFYKFFPAGTPSEFSAAFSESIQDSSNGNVELNGMELANSITQGLYSNYNFFVILLLPFVALGSYLSLKPQKHNFPEHLVFQAYIQSFLGYVAIVFQVFFVNVLGWGSTDYFDIYLIVSLLYSNYVFYKLYQYKFKVILWMNIKFFFIIILLSLILLALAVLCGTLFF